MVRFPIIWSLGISFLFGIRYTNNTQLFQYLDQYSNIWHLDVRFTRFHPSVFLDWCVPVFMWQSIDILRGVAPYSRDQYYWSSNGPKYLWWKTTIRNLESILYLPPDFPYAVTVTFHIKCITQVDNYYGVDVGFYRFWYFLLVAINNSLGRYFQLSRPI